MSEFDVFVLPSKIEGTPISLMEAMSAGRTVICSDISALCDIVTDGVDGLLFKVGDANRLAEVLFRLKNDSVLRKMLGDNAQKSCEKFDANVIYSRILSSYN